METTENIKSNNNDASDNETKLNKIDLDISNMETLIWFHDGVKQYDRLILKENVRKLPTNFSNIEELNLDKNKSYKLALVYHQTPTERIPINFNLDPSNNPCPKLFLDACGNSKSLMSLTPKEYVKSEILGKDLTYLCENYNIKILDLLTCDKLPFAELDNIKIRYSLDKTGNPNEDSTNWILESDNINIKDEYFLSTEGFTEILTNGNDGIGIYNGSNGIEILSSNQTGTGIEYIKMDNEIDLFNIKDTPGATYKSAKIIYGDDKIYNDYSNNLLTDHEITSSQYYNPANIGSYEYFTNGNIGNSGELQNMINDRLFYKSTENQGDGMTSSNPIRVNLKNDSLDNKPFIINNHKALYLYHYNTISYKNPAYNNHIRGTVNYNVQSDDTINPSNKRYANSNNSFSIFGKSIVIDGKNREIIIRNAGILKEPGYSNYYDNGKYINTSIDTGENSNHQYLPDKTEGALFRIIGSGNSEQKIVIKNIIISLENHGGFSLVDVGTSFTGSLIIENCVIRHKNPDFARKNLFDYTNIERVKRYMCLSMTKMMNFAGPDWVNAINDYFDDTGTKFIGVGEVMNDELTYSQRKFDNFAIDQNIPVNMEHTMDSINKNATDSQKLTDATDKLFKTGFFPEMKYYGLPEKFDMIKTLFMNYAAAAHSYSNPTNNHWYKISGATNNMPALKPIDYGTALPLIHTIFDDEIKKLEKDYLQGTTVEKDKAKQQLAFMTDCSLPVQFNNIFSFVDTHFFISSAFFHEDTHYQNRDLKYKDKKDYVSYFNPNFSIDTLTDYTIKSTTGWIEETYNAVPEILLDHFKQGNSSKIQISENIDLGSDETLPYFNNAYVKLIESDNDGFTDASYQKIRNYTGDEKWFPGDKANGFGILNLETDIDKFIVRSLIYASNSCYNVPRTEDFSSDMMKTARKYTYPTYRDTYEEVSSFGNKIGFNLKIDYVNGNNLNSIREYGLTFPKGGIKEIDRKTYNYYGKQKYYYLDSDDKITETEVMTPPIKYHVPCAVKVKTLTPAFFYYKAKEYLEEGGFLNPRKDFLIHKDYGLNKFFVRNNGTNVTINKCHLKLPNITFPMSSPRIRVDSLDSFESLFTTKNDAFVQYYLNNRHLDDGNKGKRGFKIYNPHVIHPKIKVISGNSTSNDQERTSGWIWNNKEQYGAHNSDINNIYKKLIKKWYSYRSNEIGLQTTLKENLRKIYFETNLIKEPVGIDKNESSWDSYYAKILGNTGESLGTSNEEEIPQTFDSTTGTPEGLKILRELFFKDDRYKKFGGDDSMRINCQGEISPPTGSFKEFFVDDVSVKKLGRWFPDKEELEGVSIDSPSPFNKTGETDPLNSNGISENWDGLVCYGERGHGAGASTIFHYPSVAELSENDPGITDIADKCITSIAVYDFHIKLKKSIQFYYYYTRDGTYNYSASHPDHISTNITNLYDYEKIKNDSVFETYWKTTWPNDSEWPPSDFLTNETTIRPHGSTTGLFINNVTSFYGLKWLVDQIPSIVQKSNGEFEIDKDPHNGIYKVFTKFGRSTKTEHDNVVIPNSYTIKKDWSNLHSFVSGSHFTAILSDLYTEVQGNLDIFEKYSKGEITQINGVNVEPYPMFKDLTIFKYGLTFNKGGSFGSTNFNKPDVRPDNPSSYFNGGAGIHTSWLTPWAKPPSMGYSAKIYKNSTNTSVSSAGSGIYNEGYLPANIRYVNFQPDDGYSTQLIKYDDVIFKDVSNNKRGLMPRLIRNRFISLFYIRTSNVYSSNGEEKTKIPIGNEKIKNSIINMSLNEDFKISTNLDELNIDSQILTDKLTHYVQDAKPHYFPFEENDGFNPIDSNDEHTSGLTFLVFDNNKAENNLILTRNPYHIPKKTGLSYSPNKNILISIHDLSIDGVEPATFTDWWKPRNSATGNVEEYGDALGIKNRDFENDYTSDGNIISDAFQYMIFNSFEDNPYLYSVGINEFTKQYETDNTLRFNKQFYLQNSNNDDNDSYYYIDNIVELNKDLDIAGLTLENKKLTEAKVVEYKLNGASHKVSNNNFTYLKDNNNRGDMYKIFDLFFTDKLKNFYYSVQNKDDINKRYYQDLESKMPMPSGDLYNNLERTLDETLNIWTLFDSSGYDENGTAILSIKEQFIEWLDNRFYKTIQTSEILWSNLNNTGTDVWTHTGGNGPSGKIFLTNSSNINTSIVSKEHLKDIIYELTYLFNKTKHFASGNTSFTRDDNKALYNNETRDGVSEYGDYADAFIVSEEYLNNIPVFQKLKENIIWIFIMIKTEFYTNLELKTGIIEV